MLTHHRKSVCLSLVSTDMPVWSVMETPATLYQKDREKFHLLLSTPPTENSEAVHNNSQTENSYQEQGKTNVLCTPQVLWLEISSCRVIMSMQGSGKLSYRHCWQEGVSGITRYWLPSDGLQPSEPIRLRNFTRSLKLNGYTLPEHLRVDYELWAGEVQLGSYVLDLQVKH